MSFREFCEQQDREGAEMVRRRRPLPDQDPEHETEVGRARRAAVPDTAFGVLFLLRSMKKSLEKAYAYGDGTMVGGRGIPKDTSKVELRGGQVVPRSLLGPGREAVGRPGQPGRQRLRSARSTCWPSCRAISSNRSRPSTRSKIRRLVSNKSPAARLAAVRALGKTRDLDNADVLIYALTDPDADVVRAANEGLLRISRSPLLVQLPDDFTDDDRRAVIEKWKAWYRAIRPKADVDF